MYYTRKDVIADVIFISVILLVLGALFCLLKSPAQRVWKVFSGQESTRPSMPAEGTMLHYEWSIETLDGKTVPMSDFKGKVIFLNFWATWCMPCRMEMPSIDKLYAAYRDKDVVFLCLSNEDPTVLKTFVHKKGLEAPVYVARNIPGALGVSGLPATFIIARDGKIVLAATGARDWNKKPVRMLIEKLLQK